MSQQKSPSAPENPRPETENGAPESFAVPAQIAPRGEIFDLDSLPTNSRALDWRRLLGPGFLIVGALCLAAFFVGASVGENRRKPTPVGPFPAHNAALESIKVHVAGQVKKPGVYTLREDARIQDALQKAGGALPKADLSALNLAAWAEDGAKITVPARVTAKPTPVVIVKEVPVEVPVPVPVESARLPSAPAETAASLGASARVSASGSDGAAPAKKAKATDGLPRATTPSGAESANLSPAYLRSNPVNLNSATAAQLEVLPGIGPKMGERIVAYRAENGKFRSVDELDNVKGIGEKTLEKLRPFVVAR